MSTRRVKKNDEKSFAGRRRIGYTGRMESLNIDIRPKRLHRTYRLPEDVVEFYEVTIMKESNTVTADLRNGQKITERDLLEAVVRYARSRYEAGTTVRQLLGLDPED